MTARIGDLAGRGPTGLKIRPQTRDGKRRAKPGECTAIRKSAAGEQCTLRLPGVCNRDPATTILAHLRMFGAAGMGQKPADYAAVYACHACHDALDRRDMMTAGQCGMEDILRGLMETHRRLAAKGLLHMGKIEQ